MVYRLVIIVLLVLAELPVDAATSKGVILANELSGRPWRTLEVVATGANPEHFGRLSVDLPWSFRKRNPAIRWSSS